MKRNIAIHQNCFSDLRQFGQVVPRNGYYRYMTGLYVGRIYKVLCGSNEELISFAECTQDSPFNLRLIVSVGDELLAWNGNAWKEAGSDKGDNSQFWQKAVVKNAYVFKGDFLVDVVFDDGTESNDHFYLQTKPIEENV